jgi:hypothetical protein
VILLNFFSGIRGTLYDVPRFHTYAVWFAHPFYLDEAANQLNVTAQGKGE